MPEINIQMKEVIGQKLCTSHSVAHTIDIQLTDVCVCVCVCVCVRVCVCVCVCVALQ